MSDETVISPGPYFRLTPGTRLNGIYEIDRYITSGGMGEIYRGRAVVTGDVVAIKTVRPDLAQNDTALALFRKEAASLHNLYNEAIVRYFVFTIDPVLGIPYLAMEFVEGESLSDILRRGALGTPDICVLMRRLALGLQAAHQLGIVHRDLSPDNVLVPGGDVSRAKIIDFGIARSPLGEGTLIGSGFAGKMNYVSPEQLGLFGGEVGPPSDIYSLGLVMAEAARGKILDMGHSHVEVIDRRRRVPDLAGIDPDLRTILQRMLQPNPKDRPQSMAEIAAWVPKVAPSGGRRWLLAGAAAIVLIAGGLGAALLTGTLDLGGLWPRTGGEPGQRAAEPASPNRTNEAARLAPEPPVFPPELPPARPEPRQEPLQGPRQEPRTETARRESPPVDGPRQDAPRQDASRQDAPRQDPQRQEESRLEEPPPERPRNDPALAHLPPPSGSPEAPPSQGRQRRETSLDQVRDFLRGYSGGQCFFITPVTLAMNEATIEAFGSTPAPFMAFDEAFQRTLGFEPEINLRQITAAQCPLVDYLARQGAQRGAAKPALSLKADTLRSGDELVVTSDTKADRTVELLLISDEGTVHSLAAYAKKAGDALTAKLRVVGNERSADAQPQLVVALASHRPLAGAMAAVKAGGISADRFFKLVSEDAAKSGPIGISVKYFKLSNGA
ncbi:serine/threonine-protein kinase [Methylobacterium sp. BE186]|uniref:serine/threonine-protein kinase n=1 Tax=Methylobacterium sp. BE186 TaxID=2817715 RepID=UPI00285EB75A|nr:protein kinase [Methylobacterium sp. BE186]MDR7040146.1 serine/threonine-protein kinase [Methylobacterium sp. BE186]